MQGVHFLSLSDPFNVLRIDHNYLNLNFLVVSFNDCGVPAYPSTPTVTRSIADHKKE